MSSLPSPASSSGIRGKRNGRHTCHGCGTSIQKRFQAEGRYRHCPTCNYAWCFPCIENRMGGLPFLIDDRCPRCSDPPRCCCLPNGKKPKEINCSSNIDTVMHCKNCPRRPFKRKSDKKEKEKPRAASLAASTTSSATITSRQSDGTDSVHSSSQDGGEGTVAAESATAVPAAHYPASMQTLGSAMKEEAMADGMGWEDPSMSVLPGVDENGPSALGGAASLGADPFQPPPLPLHPPLSRESSWNSTFFGPSRSRDNSFSHSLSSVRESFNFNAVYSQLEKEVEGGGVGGSRSEMRMDEEGTRHEGARRGTEEEEEEEEKREGGEGEQVSHVGTRQRGTATRLLIEEKLVERAGPIAVAQLHATTRMVSRILTPVVSDSSRLRVSLSLEERLGGWEEGREEGEAGEAESAKLLKEGSVESIVSPFKDKGDDESCALRLDFVFKDSVSVNGGEVLLQGRGFGPSCRVMYKDVDSDQYRDGGDALEARGDTCIVWYAPPRHVGVIEVCVRRMDVLSNSAKLAYVYPTECFIHAVMPQFFPPPHGRRGGGGGGGNGDENGGGGAGGGWREGERSEGGGQSGGGESGEGQHLGGGIGGSEWALPPFGMETSDKRGGQGELDSNSLLLASEGGHLFGSGSFRGSDAGGFGGYFDGGGMLSPTLSATSGDMSRLSSAQSNLSQGYVLTASAYCSGAKMGEGIDDGDVEVVVSMIEADANQQSCWLEQNYTLAGNSEVYPRGNALIAAIIRQDVSMVDKLLSLGANPHSDLLLTADTRIPALITSCIIQNNDIFNLLVHKCGGSLDGVCSSTLDTAVHIAAVYNNENMVTTLMSAMSDRLLLLARNRLGFTPVHYAVLMQGDSTLAQMMAELKDVQSGEMGELEAKRGEWGGEEGEDMKYDEMRAGRQAHNNSETVVSPLDLALSSFEKATFGEGPSTGTPSSRRDGVFDFSKSSLLHPKVVKVLQIPYQNGLSVLHLAALIGRLKAMHTLLDYGLSGSALTPQGNSILNLMLASSGHLPECEPLFMKLTSKAEVAALLLLASPRGLFPIDYAFMNTTPEFTKTVVEATETAARVTLQARWQEAATGRISFDSFFSPQPSTTSVSDLYSTERPSLAATSFFADLRRGSVGGSTSDTALPFISGALSGKGLEQHLSEIGSYTPLWGSVLDNGVDMTMVEVTSGTQSKRSSWKNVSYSMMVGQGGEVVVVGREGRRRGSSSSSERGGGNGKFPVVVQGRKRRNSSLSRITLSRQHSGKNLRGRASSREALRSLLVGDGGISLTAAEKDTLPRRGGVTTTKRVKGGEEEEGEWQEEGAYAEGGRAGTGVIEVEEGNMGGRERKKSLHKKESKKVGRHLLPGASVPSEGGRKHRMSGFFAKNKAKKVEAQ